jgi:hypothetical protein
MQHFGKTIGHLIFVRDKLDVKQLVGNSFSDEVIVNFNMLGPSMKTGMHKDM